MTAAVDAAPAPLADLLVRHRIAAGLRQAELASMSGLSERAVRDLERGATARPRRDSVLALASALKLTGAQLSAFLAASAFGRASSEPGGVTTARLDPLVGRHIELRSLHEMIVGGRHRLISVTGAGGVGKTRLAASLADELAQRLWDVRTVDVSTLDDPSLVLQTVAEVFGEGGATRLGPIERLAARLRGTRSVIVVDGMERMISAAPDLSMLVRRCTGLTVVVTSQLPLRVSGERQLRLAPLSPAAAVTLFAARAAAFAEGFQIDETSRDAVAAICRRVDGLPLAIELAAARMRLLTPAELLERLDRPLHLLADGGPDLPARHRSLRATIMSTLDVVTHDAGMLFDLLGAFSGGAGLDDLESVAAGGWRGHSLLDALAELVDTSLVRIHATGGDTRYTLPDTVRDVAKERLAGGPDGHRAHRALAEHYLGQIRQGGCERRLAARDAANVRSAIGWAVAHEPHLFDEPLVHGLFRYYEVSGRLAEGQAALDRVGSAGQPKAWIHAGHLARLRSDFTEARRLAGLALQRLSSSDHDGRCRTHLMLGSVATDIRELSTSRRELHAALVHARRAGDVRLVGRVLNNLGTLSMELGRLDAAERLLRAALEAKRRGDAGDIDCGRTLFNLAETAVDAGRYGAGLAYAEQALRQLVAGGHWRLAAFASSTAALAHIHGGDVAAAAAACVRATELLEEEEHDDRRISTIVDLRRSVAAHAAGDRAGAAALLRHAVPAGLDSPERDREELAYAIEMHAELTAPRDPVGAARMLGTAHRLRRGSIRLATPAWTSVASRAEAVCRERLGGHAFKRHHRQGFALDPLGLMELYACIERE